MDVKNEENNEIKSNQDKFCVKCGAKVEEGQLYCGTCGNKLNTVSKNIKLNKKVLIILGIVVSIFIICIGRHIIVFNKAVNDYRENYESMGFEVDGNIIKNTVYIDSTIDGDYDNSYYSNFIVKSLWSEHEILAEDITSMVQSNIKNNYKIKVNVINRLYDDNDKLLLEAKNGEVTYNIENND